MRKLSKPLLMRIIAIILAVFLGLFCTYQLREHLSANTPKDVVLVAAVDIMPNTIITSDYITQVQLPMGSKMANTVREPNNIVGKKTTAIIYKGEQFLSQKIAEQHITTNPGERVLSIPIDLVRSVGMTIKPGDQVDIYWLQENNKSISGATNTKAAVAIAHCATILDLRSKNSNSAFTVTATPENEDNAKDQKETPAVAIIKVKNEETDAIFTAIGTGQIYLAKRPLIQNPSAQ